VLTVFLTLLSLVLTLLVGAALLAVTFALMRVVVRHLEANPTYSDDVRRKIRALAVRRPARR
jgi:uncharacterized protein YneF (UPF0154 family)